MQRRTSLASLASLVVASLVSGGCAPDPVVAQKRSIDLAPLVKDGAIGGISLDGDLIDVVVGGLGILTVDREGNEVARIERGERGLLDLPYKDVAARGGDVFILLADNEGYLYDAVTEQQRVHFCVEPGWEPEPNGPVLSQKNDAVSINGNTILAAPRFYSDDTMTESAIRTYRAADGVQLTSVDVTEHALELTGLAQHGDELWGVQDGSLHRFDLDGALLGTVTLDGVGDASGLALSDAGEVLVADDDAQAIAVFDTAAL